MWLKYHRKNPNTRGKSHEAHLTRKMCFFWEVFPEKSVPKSYGIRD